MTRTGGDAHRAAVAPIRTAELVSYFLPLRTALMIASGALPPVMPPDPAGLTVGVRHEDELIKAVEILAQKVHPLALGNVERFISQSRMIARKILLTHMRT